MATVGGPIRFGAYVLLEKLGEGAQGDVWLARDTRRATGAVVVKRMDPSRIDDERFRQRFLHEATIARAVSHPNVVAVVDGGEVDGRLFLAMAYVAGRPLGKIIRELSARGARCSVRSAIDVVAQALDGLEALHTAVDERGAPLEIVHRDVAPKNLMLEPSGRTKVIDFGIGRSAAREWKTATGVIMGSPGYMAPEQILGQRVDARADLYAIAVVAYELLTLRRYVPGRTVVELVTRSLKDNFQSIADARSDAPRALDAVLRRALALRAEDRFSSAAELKQALTALELPAASAPPLIALVPWEEIELEKTRVAALVEDTWKEAPPETRLIEAPGSTVADEPSRPRAAKYVALAGTIALASAAAFVAWPTTTVPRAPPTAPVAEPARPRITPRPRARTNEPAPPPELVDAPPAARRRARRTAPEVEPDVPEEAPTVDPKVLIDRVRALPQAAMTDEQRREARALLMTFNRSLVEAQRGRTPASDAALSRLRRLERDLAR